MSVEKISPEQKIQTQESVSDDKTSTEEKQAQVDTQNESKEKQDKVDEQSLVDKANQELAKIPQKIEDDLDDFNKLLKKLMAKNVSPKVDINSPEFDVDVMIGDLNKILTPLLGALSPIESIVGKVPVVGDLGTMVKKLASNTETGGLTKEEIKKLVPKAPEIPPSLKNKVQETVITVQEFCAQLPMLLFKVIFAMLIAIYDMFDQIVGIIGVPPAIYPFSMVKQLPLVVQKIMDFVTNAPSEIKGIVEGKMKDMMAAAQALAIPKPPTQTPTGVKKEDKKEEKKDDGGLPPPGPPPEPAQQAPAESEIVEVPQIQPKPPVQKEEKYKEFIVHLEFSGCDPKHTSIVIPKGDSKITLQNRLDDYLKQPIEEYKDIQEISKYSQYKYIPSSELTTKQAIHAIQLYFDLGWKAENGFYYQKQKYEVTRFVVYQPSNDNNITVRYKQLVLLIADNDEDDDEETSLPDDVGLVD